MEKNISALANPVTKSDPFRALEEIIYLLDGGRNQDGLKPLDRFKAVEGLDARAHGVIETLTQQYTAESGPLQRLQEERIWNAVVEYWRHLGAAYEDCFWQYQAGERGAGALKPHIATIVSRAIRSLGAELKWTMMAYAPADPTLWGRMGALYVIAEQGGFEDEPCLIYESSSAESAVRLEYLRVLMFAMAAVDTLTPLRVDVADRLTAGFVTAFKMQTQPGKGCHYYVDLSAAKPPARLVERLLSPAPNPRYYGPGQAGAQSEKLIQLLQSRNEVPADLELGLNHKVELVVDVLRHLARQWASIPPARNEERAPTSARVHLVHDFDTVLKAACGVGRNPALERDMESWTMHDASDGGFSAVLPTNPQDWVRVGTLIATRMEGTVSWGVGVVRRISTTAIRQRLVGIQMMSRGATPVQLFTSDADVGTTEGEVALLLPSSGESSASRGEVTLLLRTGSFYSHRPTRMEIHQHAYQLMPKQLMEAGRDFEMVRFRVLTR